MFGRGTAPTAGWSVRAQLAAIVSVVAVLIVGAGTWLAVVSLRDAEDEARDGVRFQAGLAADSVEDALSQGTSAVAGLAAGFPVAQLAVDASKCTLSFSDLGVFPSGHIDIVLPDGQVPCSSVVERGAPPGATQAGAPWLASRRTMRAPSVAGVFTDRLTGEQAAAVTAPIAAADGGPPDGYVALVLPLDGLAKGLADVYGGPQHLTFTIHDKDGRLVSRDPDEPADELIVDHDRVPGVRWTVTAQQSRDTALAATRTAVTRFAALAGAAFVLLLALLVAVNRSIGHPLRRLTHAAAQSARQVNPDPVPESGPAEVRRLARTFNEMTTARAGYEHQLTHHALHDPLTGLPNRALCLDRIGQAMQGAGPSPSRVAVLSVDLDRFKLVNASLGYGVGDDILVAAAARVASLLGTADTLARAGGDGFVVCRADAADSRAAEALAVQIMAALADPFTAAGTDVTLTASVGIARGRRGSTPEELVRDADTAMYAAKKSGGGRFRLIDDELRAASSERLSLEADLRAAMAAGQLQVHYQPVVNLVTGKISGAEALLRWTHPTRGPVSPMSFIPVAEDAGLIGPIGLYVLRQACVQTASWNAVGHRLRVAVNVSALQLHDPGFVAQVAAEVHRAGIDPAQLCLELTESTLMDDAMRVSDVLAELKDVGVDLSVDDFGTGYSSLAYLKRFPVDELKVDRSFISSLDDGGQDQTLVAAMVAMGHALGLNVVAEGVETDAQMATLLTLGCRSAQGYLFAKPQPADHVSVLLERGLPVELRSGADQRPNHLA